MLFIFVISLLLFVLFVFYTIQNRRKYGTYAFPLIITIILGGTAIWSGIKSPQKFQELMNRKEITQAGGNELSDEDRRNLQDTYKKTTGIDASAGLDTSMQDETVASQLSKSLSNIGTVAFDPETHAFRITISPNSDWYNGVSYIEGNPGTAADSGWSNVSDSIKSISQQISDGFKSGYLITLQGISNPNQVLVSAKDGQIQYDFTGLS